ncbi:MAG: EscU/YscU/HrcU family type III secretion system export apparatus switch protein [Treponema sp.]|nr:EscU/YscU/HrcU family type III secretion system export apparatus switch protein [Treponema sp.]MDY5763530.1 EscU/YscU/HrcU family type III secretion system export apparatus switch protein [Treponema sp.]
MNFEQINLQWFAAEDEGRTEEPSELRLRKAREEGRVAKSQELNSSVVFFLAVLVLLFLANGIFKSLVIMLLYFLSHVADEAFSFQKMSSLFFEAILKNVVPFASVGLIAGVISNIAQNKGFIFTLKPLTPDFKKIIPNFSQYFKNTLFSFKGIFNVFKSILKVIVIVVIGYYFVKKNIPVFLMEIQNHQILVCVQKIAEMVFQFLIIIAVFFLGVSVIDYFIQKKSFMEEMKMTKYEVKQELKEMEADPEVKSRLKAAQRQLLNQNIPKAVKESDVVITNPTHYAVSLKYDSLVDVFPRVSAKGVDELALQIKSIARENDVPTVENRALARDLYNSTDIDQMIPESYCKIIAVIYAELKKFNINA